MPHTIYIKTGIIVGILLFLSVILAGVYDRLSYSMFDLFRVLIFVISLWYFLWHYRVTKTHVPSYERVSEGAIIAAIIFNPLLQFNLDLGVWIFLEGVFMWVFAIFLARIRKIERNLKEKNRHWIDLG